LAALALGVPASGAMLGVTPGYVKANSQEFAASLLDLSRGGWSQEGRANFAVSKPALELASESSASYASTIEPPPTEATKGGATTCPAYYTICPDGSATKCEWTKCPPVTTKCSATPTLCAGGNSPTKCPAVFTKCPPLQTVCPVKATVCEVTICPAVPTQCPVVATTCDFTKCPAHQTMCPVVPTTCELTFCPKTTMCGNEPTICYGTGGPQVCQVGDVASTPLVEPEGHQLAWLAAPREPAARPLALTFVPQTN
jgi:hypothetical protein